MFTKIAKQQLQENQTVAAADFLDKIMQYSETVIEKTGGLIWMMQPESDTQAKMLHRLQHFSESVTRARQIQLVYEIGEGVLLPVDQLQYRKNIYLISLLSD